MVTTSKRNAEKSPRKQAQEKSAPAKATQTISSNGLSRSNPDTLRHLYTSLLRCRLMQEHAYQLSLDNYDLTLVDEAVVVGPTAELNAEDTMACDNRNLAALVARGLRFACQLSDQGVSSQYASPGSLTSASLPQDPFHLGTGIALAHKLAKNRHVVVAFCPQESPALETWHDALKFAGVHKLPILYVIKNGVADQRSSEDHAPHLEAFSFMARDYGYPGIIVDGQDVVAVWRVAQESIHRARNGSGPTLIDCRTDPSRDPLQHMEHYMRKRGVWNDKWKTQTEAEIRKEIEKA